MHNKLVKILEDLGIDIGFMEYEGNSSEYIIFDIYNEVDTDFSDDISLADTYYIQVNYWFKSLKNLNKYNEIKELLKNNGFIFDGAKDVKDSGYYGKNMDFIYINYEREGISNG